MKITAVETFPVKPRWLFVKVSTDAGLVGWGEPAGEERGRTVATAIAELQPALIGQDAGRIEHLWQLMCRCTSSRGGPILAGAISGIEQALWDLKGKALNVPAYELLGGSCRTRIRMLAPCGGLSPQDATLQAKALRVKGYTAVRVDMEGLPARMLESAEFIDKVVARVAAIREEVGRGVDVVVDLNGRASPALARRLIEQLEPLYPMFVAEPGRPEHVSALAQIAAGTTVPLATGQRLYARAAFRDVLADGAAAVLQPAPSTAGGIFEARKIAAMAEAYAVGVAPHNRLGPVALAACLQLAACTPNFLVQEHAGMSNKWDVGFGYLATPFNVREGYIELPKGPGLGIEVLEDALRERAFEGDWDSPRRTHADDHSVADG